MMMTTINISRQKLLIIRFLLNPISHKNSNRNSLISSTTSSLSSSIHTSTYNSKYQFRNHRCFSITSHASRQISDQNVALNRNIANPKSPIVSPNLISQLIDVIKISNGNCRSKLDSMEIKLSKISVCEILRGLSFEKVLAFQFFDWVRDNNRDLHRNGDVCSLVIDNCGWLEDYDTMKSLLKRFKHEEICLNDKAFLFLPVLDSSKAHATVSIKNIIHILDEIGGSVYNSGVFALINMLCVIDHFELAKFVMEITERKSNYYAILVREKCRKRHLEEAYALLDEMRAAGCEPDCKMYNYILGSLCKSEKLSEALNLLEEMKKTGVDPDSITFEIFISSSCKLGRMEFANESLKRLMQSGHPPRISTHIALVKGYFNIGRYTEAYEYVRDLEMKKMPAINRMYSLLARMHQRKGNIDGARLIFNEMMEKGLKPDFLYYAKTVNVLRHTGGKDLARDLQKKYSNFVIKKEC